MGQQSKKRKVISRVAGGAVAVLLVAGIGAGGYVGHVFNQSLPQTTGTIELAGLSGQVSIKRDGNGIPNIYASSDKDLFFAQGFVHAQDRFFEMDYRRHLTGGRLTEIVGDNETAKQADVVIRTMGWRKLAETEWESLSDEARGFYQAYADGVNAYIAGKDPAALAAEYAVLGLQLPVKDIEPWQGVDSLAWLKAMAWDLKANIDDENLRAQAYQQLGDVAAVEALFAKYDENARKPVIPDTEGSNLTARAEYPRGSVIPLPSQTSAVSSTAATAGATPGDGDTKAAASDEHAVLTNTAAGAVASADSVLAAMPEILGKGQGVGSNSFVISGKYTASGKPILANDPHLGIEFPSVWYQIGLHCTRLTSDCTFDVSGFSFSGMPGVIIGRNADLAWGLTNLGGDVADYVIEKNTGANTYERDGKDVAYETWEETFKVAGGEDYTKTVRRSVHGPIVSDLLIKNEVAGELPGAPGEFSVALEWTALKPDTTGEAIFAINRSRTPEDIAKAAALFAVPAQNIVYATAAGDIGYQAPGRFPVRPHVAPSDGNLDAVPNAENLGADGRWPRPGWDSSYDWQGYYAASDMPSLINPASGVIVPANQRITPAGLGPYLGSYADGGFRATQIREGIAELQKQGKITLDAAHSIMLLDASPYGTELVPRLLQTKLTGSHELEMQQVLADWVADGAHTDTASVGATVAAGVYAHLLHEMMNDDINGFTPGSGSQFMQLAANQLQDPDGLFWDDKRTSEKETADDIIARAFTAAYADLSERLGENIYDWHWGRAHVETPTHDVLGGESLPEPIRKLFNAEAVAVPGGATITNAMNFAPTVDAEGHTSFEVTSGPSMRMVVDLADVDNAQWVISSGATAHPNSTNRTDQLELWAEGRSLRWYFRELPITVATENELTLEPRK